MNELIPSNPPPVLAAVLLVLPFLSLYALWRIHRATGPRFLRWNRVPPLPFSIFEMVVILALVALAMQSGLLILLPFVAYACASWYTQKHGLLLATQWGLAPAQVPPSLRAALNCYFALLLPVAAASAFSFYLCERLGYPELLQPVATEILESGPLKTLGLLLLATLFAPLWEEMVFRGLVYPWLKSKMPQKAALVLSAVFFAAIHHHLPSFLPLALLGLILALVYEYTGSLLSSIALHGLFNFATCVNLLMMRGT